MYANEYACVNTEELKNVILSQKNDLEDLFNREKIVERDIDKTNIKKLISHPNILAILGARRSGKSVFCWLLMRGEKFGYINFFDERLAEMRAEELNKVLQAFYELFGQLDYFVFDEIQKVSGWERFVSRLRASKKIIITGSNSSLLRGNLSTFITGRHLDVELLPFSFSEYLRLNDFILTRNWQYSIDDISTVKNLLNQYLKEGGFPEVRVFGPIILQTIYKDIVENDIIGQHNIRNIKGLKELVKYLITNTASEVSYNSLQKSIGIKDAHTISNYVSYISDSYLVFLLERFSYKLKEQFRAPKKVYCIDPGIVDRVSLKLSRNIGKIMENVVFIELLRRKFQSNSDSEIYYWKDHRSREVDFVVKNGNSVEKLIQVTYASEKDELIQREINALILGSNELKCSNLEIITWDLDEIYNLEGRKIKITPIWKWLLGTAAAIDDE